MDNVLVTGANGHVGYNIIKGLANMDYDEITKHCEKLDYRDKLCRSQLLLQMARETAWIKGLTLPNIVITMYI